MCGTYIDKPWHEVTLVTEATRAGEPGKPDWQACFLNLQLNNTGVASILDLIARGGGGAN